MAAIFACCAPTGTDFGTAEKLNKIIWIYFLQDWTPGELLNILMYDIAMYTRANVEKIANSQVHLDARSDYRDDHWWLSVSEQHNFQQENLAAESKLFTDFPLSKGQRPDLMYQILENLCTNSAGLYRGIPFTGKSVSFIQESHVLTLEMPAGDHNLTLLRPSAATPNEVNEESGHNSSEVTDGFTEHCGVVCHGLYI